MLHMPISVQLSFVNTTTFEKFKMLSLPDFDIFHSKVVEGAANVSF